MAVNVHFFPIVLSNLNKPWEQVLHLGTPISFPAKSVITGRSPGVSKEPGMYYIKSGRVRLSHLTMHGHEKMLLYMGSGMLFNEVPMLRVASDYMFTCLDATDAVYWTRKCITHEFILEHPDLILNLMEAMGSKTQSFYTQLCGMSSYGAFINVCRVLYSMFLFQQERGNVVPGLTKQELAAYLGIHRSSLHKALARLQDENVIGSYTRSSLQVSDVETLRNYAEQLIED